MNLCLHYNQALLLLLLPMDTWPDRRKAFARCTAGLTASPAHNLYVTWNPGSASLGHGLQAFVSVFLYALITGRQPIGGDGQILRLLCGPSGAYSCGIATHYAHIGSLHKDAHLVVRDGWPDVFDTKDHVHAMLYEANVPVNLLLHRAVAFNSTQRLVLKQCLITSMQCGSEELEEPQGLEGCIMARAMQLLLPNMKLKPRWAKRAFYVVKDAWLGKLAILKETLLSNARLAGSMHVRTLSSNLSNEFRRYLSTLDSTSPYYNGLWSCAGQCLPGQGQIYVASEFRSVCQFAHATNPDLFVCIDLDRTQRHRANSSYFDIEMDPRELAVLDWHLLARSSWSVAITRRGDSCAPASPRLAMNTPYASYSSFAASALAASGRSLARPPFPCWCPCGIQAERMSLLYPTPRERPKWLALTTTRLAIGTTKGAASLSAFSTDISRSHPGRSGGTSFYRPGASNLRNAGTHPSDPSLLDTFIFDTAEFYARRQRA